MTDESQIFELVKALSDRRGERFSKLLELHGVPDNEQAEYMKRAQSMSQAVVELCRGYCVQAGQEDGKLFAALATGMAMDSLLHTLITKEQSDSVLLDKPAHTQH